MGEAEVDEFLDNDIEDFEFEPENGDQLEISSAKYSFKSRLPLSEVEEDLKVKLFKTMAKRIKQLKQNIRDIRISSKRIAKRHQSS